MLYLIIFNRSEVIEKNLRTKPSSYQSLFICHWNLNSISAYNFLKLSLSRAYLTDQNFDVTCLSETFLDSSISYDDDYLQIPGYNL